MVAPPPAASRCIRAKFFLALSYSVLDDVWHPSHGGGSGVFWQAEFREPVHKLLRAALAPISHPTGTIESSSDKLLPSYDGGHRRPRQTALGSAAVRGDASSVMRF
jgi:hypothetical protein